MSYKVDHNVISYLHGKEVLATVEFPQYKHNIVRITHTFVDEKLRGQGVASRLMEELVRVLADTQRQAILVCSYAKKWFSAHPEYSYLVYEENED